MENKQSTKKQTLIHIALVVGGFVAGSVIWGNGSNIMNSNDSANESVKKQQIELANRFNALAQTANQVNKPAGLVLTEQDKELIGKTAAQYLIEHPENLVEAGKRLEANRDGEKTSDVVNTKDVLLETKFTPNYGPDNADVAVIEFSITCVISVSSPVPCLKRRLQKIKMFGLSLKTSPFLLTAHLSPGWGQKLVSTSLISTGRKNTTSSIISS